MKLISAAAVVALVITGANGFSSSSIEKAPCRRQDTTLAMSVADRRTFASATSLAFLGGVATAAAAGAGCANPALAVGYFDEYKPKYEDLKQIYILGVTLDNLAAKVADQDKWSDALDGLRLFNKEPGFYNGYAKNYIFKSVKKNAENDPRVGYIKQASAEISSIQELLEGGESGLSGSAASDEAVKRVRNAQRLIAKFLAESGVVEDKVTAYISAHP